MPNGIVNDLAAIVADPYLNETGFFVPVDHPSEGATVTMAIAPEFSRSKPELGLPPPRLGEHNAELLGELGYNAAEVAELTSI